MKLKFWQIIAFLSTCALGLGSVTFFVFIYPRKTIAPILLYHSVSDPRKTPSIPALSPGLFSRQLEYLKNNGYQPVYLDTLIETLKEKKTVPANWVVITFDDGFEDFYSTVYPLLKRYGFKATLFVAPGIIGKLNGYLSWEQLRIISAEGLVEIGSHALMHSPLICLEREEAKRRIIASKSILEKNLDKEVHVFAYPYGALNYDIRNLVETCGYQGAAGTVYPRGQFKIRDIYNLRRVYVSDVSKYPWVFKFMLSGYYVPVRAIALRLFNIHVPRDVGSCVYVM